MKFRSMTLVLLAGIGLCSAGIAQNSGRKLVPLQEFQQVRNPFNPAPFQQFLTPPSQRLQYLFSPQAAQFAGSHPALRTLWKKAGLQVPVAAHSGVAQGSSLTTQGGSGSKQSTQTSSTSVPCGTAGPALFNLEGPSGLAEIGYRVPQNEESVDFIPGVGTNGADLVIQGANDDRGFFVAQADGISFALQDPPNSWGLGTTGYYVRRTATCGVDFEGALPSITLPPLNGVQEVLFGLGDPAFAADATRNQVYAADLRSSSGGINALGLFRTSADNLTNPITCPSGTQLTDPSGNETTTQACWPVGIALAPQTSTFFAIPDKPHLAVDQRRTGTGAGDVYVTWTFFDSRTAPPTATMHMQACRGVFRSGADCSPETVISGPDTNTQFSHISIHPNGVITITYVNIRLALLTPFGAVAPVFDIKYVSCTPQGAPSAPVCSAPSLITSETQPLTAGGVLSASEIRVGTYPTHDARVNSGRDEEFIAWSRCKNSPIVLVGAEFETLACADADIVFTSSLTDSSGNPLGWKPISALNTAVHDQIFPWVKVDRSANTVAVAYYSSQSDTLTGHRFNLMRSSFAAGSYTPTTATLSAAFDPAADTFEQGQFIGDYIGIGSRNGRSYIGFTGTATKGVFGGNVIAGEDNYLVSASDK
jgi:hypothetical protein